MAQIIEGQWDDLIVRHDLHGRKVRITVVEEGPAPTKNPWLKSLIAWADSHQAADHWVDDSRDSIYGGTIDDPR